MPEELIQANVGITLSPVGTFLPQRFKSHFVFDIREVIGDFGGSTKQRMFMFAPDFDNVSHFLLSEEFLVHQVL